MEYRIGDFALITGMSVKILRNYHENGLLVPSRIDRESGYRYYDEHQIRQAAIIKTLKNWSFTLKEIGEILVECHEDGDLVEIVRRKQVEVQEKMKKLRGIDADLSMLITTEEENIKMKLNGSNKLIIKELDAIGIISISYRGRFDECGKYMGQLFRIAKSKVAGTVFNMYPEDMDLNEPEVTVCLPVKSELNHRDVQYTILPAVRVISVIHNGPYDTVGDSYKRLIDYREESSLTQKGPYREIYHKGPGMIFTGNAAKYVTELQMPVHQLRTV